MSASNGNLDSLLNVTFPVDDYGGASVQSFTAPFALNFTLTSATVDTTGNPGAGASGGSGETFKITGVHDTNNSLTVGISSNGTFLESVTEYVLGYTANAILVGFEVPSQSLGAELSGGQNVDNQIGVLSPSPLPSGTTLTFTSDGTFTGVLCFLPGTLITTPSGQTPVERLAVGDMVRTSSGEVRPITWIGVGSAPATRGRRNAATPVIVRKGALSPNVPHQDLRVTKGHSFYLDGVLIPVEFLVNHRSIVWDDRAQEVELYHVELETHDVLLANGAPAESYRDDGNRWLFQNTNAAWHSPPQEPCAPLLTSGPVVDAIWRRLLDRAGPRPGVPLTDDPDLHLLVDGQRVDGKAQVGGIYTFRVPRRPGSVRVISHAGSPGELGIARDPRLLGVALRRAVVWRGPQMHLIEASDPALVHGFHQFEEINGLRWTDGDALFPATLFDGIDGACEVELHVGCTTRYPLLAEERSIAVSAAA